MLKSILRIQGTKILSKKEQQNVTGGNSCNSYNGPSCFGPMPGCASCARWQALPLEYKNCAFVDVSCAEN
ncbi:hypothetical protein [Kordia zhangzhouensis]|uniref:hypothetical protein n=1 Tax=Kordia zhangzhouensis TaxID=1620405 RepID=UPI000629C393|nr:hypothetical protein [Kordia zhangzhouensis]